jgi:clan AA aspartic protease (TIGR02281 family)
MLQNGIWRNNEFIQANNLPPPVLSPSSSGTRVRLIREAGTFKVPVRINGVLELHFTVDSGASDVTIPADVVMTLIRTGTIRDSDFIGEQTYRLADGSTVKSRTFRIRQLQVGSRTVENVLGSVANVEGSLLLGQSFLSRFRRVSFDYGQGVLVLE